MIDIVFTLFTVCTLFIGLSSSKEKTKEFVVSLVFHVFLVFTVFTVFNVFTMSLCSSSHISSTAVLIAILLQIVYVAPLPLITGKIP